MSVEPKAKGPASYFPSIEKTYGRPVAEWQQVVRSAQPDAGGQQRRVEGAQ